MNVSYGTPWTSRIRSPSEIPNTRMNRKLDTTGAPIVWVHSFRTRLTSRPPRATSDRDGRGRRALTPPPPSP
jgi:hypothetical protein